MRHRLLHTRDGRSRRSRRHRPGSGSLSGGDRARTPSYPLADCTFAEGIAEALDAPDDSYDVVVSSLMIHHLPETLRPQAIGEMFRVLRVGGRVLIADFRPPATRLGRSLLMGHVISPAMKSNPAHLLEPMAREAGFQQVHGGEVQPWLRYVQAAKPASARRSAALDGRKSRAAAGRRSNLRAQKAMP